MPSSASVCEIGRPAELTDPRKLGYVNTMDKCGHRAVLIITREIEGTATSVARSRTELICDKPKDHEGEHSDSRNGETWAGGPKDRPTLLRHEDGT